MGIKMAFDSEANPNCQGKGPEFTGFYLKSKETYWNQFKTACEDEVRLSDVMNDLGYDMETMRIVMPDIAGKIDHGYWTSDPADIIDFGVSFDENGNFMLNFNCGMKEYVPEKKRCYFWKVYKYHVDISQITLRGWVDWCNELYQIQHGKPRPKNNRIFISPEMTTATVKGRFWNKDRIERWLNDHGYSWTQTIETKYQYHFDNPEKVELIDSDAELKARRSA